MTPQRLERHVADLTERLARLMTMADLIEKGQPLDVPRLRTALEKAHSHASGLLEEVRAEARGPRA